MELVRIKDSKYTQYIHAALIEGFYFDGYKTIITTAGGCSYCFNDDITQELAKVLTNSVGIKTIVVDKQE